MPEKNVLTLTEMMLLLLVWRVCSDVWKKAIADGSSAVIRAVFPGLPLILVNMISGTGLVVALFLAVLLFRNVNVGYSGVFRLMDEGEGEGVGGEGEGTGASGAVAGASAGASGAVAGASGGAGV